MNLTHKLENIFPCYRLLSVLWSLQGHVLSGSSLLLLPLLSPLSLPPTPTPLAREPSKYRALMFSVLHLPEMPPLYPFFPYWKRYKSKLDSHSIPTRNPFLILFSPLHSAKHSEASFHSVPMAVNNSFKMQNVFCYVLVNVFNFRI